MSVAVATTIVTVAAWYLAWGAAFAAVFLWRWVDRLDPAAREGTTGFRLLVFPGVVMLWPLFVVRLRHPGAGLPDEWTAHRATARRVASTSRREAARP